MTQEAFDLDAPAIAADPYPTYARLRATCPAGRAEGRGGYRYVMDDDHRCLGSHLARMELRIALEEAARLLPTFVLTPGRLPVRALGQIKAFDLLPLTIGDDAPTRSAVSGGC